MSKQEADLPERLRATGATSLERRLLEAAGREQPTRDLSERMAQSIGISLASLGTTPAPKVMQAGTAAGNAANTSGSLLPWISGALLTVGVVVGAFIATRPSTRPSEPTELAPPAHSVSSLPLPAATPSAAMPREDAPSGEAGSRVDDESPVRTPAPPRGRHAVTAGELAKQVAIVDSARSALAGGNPQRALSIVREYQSEYPRGAFRPEVSAVKIEALINLGRTTEARTLAERFVVAYGTGPLADRVARLAQIAQP